LGNGGKGQCHDRNDEATEAPEAATLDQSRHLNYSARHATHRAIKTVIQRKKPAIHLLRLHLKLVNELQMHARAPVRSAGDALFVSRCAVSHDYQNALQTRRFLALRRHDLQIWTIAQLNINHEQTTQRHPKFHRSN
jgi:hypothetical protein